MRRSKPKKPALQANALIEKLSHDGRGIARIEGKTTFIDGALPEESVVFEYTKRKSDFDEGRVLSVLSPSAQRVEPLCPHYNLCGGCSLQHLEAEAQIKAKQGLLLEILARVGHCQPEEIIPLISDNPWHYRNKARLSVRYVEKKSSILIGFRERFNPRYITDIHRCLVLHPKVDAVIDTLRDLVNSFENKQSIAQIELAAGDEALALIFRNLSPLSAQNQAQLIEFGMNYHFRIYLQPAGPDSIYMLHPSQGSPYLTYSLPEFSLRFDFHPADFTQVNAAINRKMVSQAIDLLALNAEDKVLDLFCGLGNFSLALARSAKQVIGIEGSAQMIERAKHNARNNDLTNVEFASADLENWSLANPLLEGVNKLLLDPPRSGALAIVKQISSLNISHIVYVSCNPLTLARDAEVLISQGYRMQAAGVMDMFPHTTHVESMALFLK